MPFSPRYQQEAMSASGPLVASATTPTRHIWAIRCCHHAPGPYQPKGQFFAHPRARQQAYPRNERLVSAARKRRPCYELEHNSSGKKYNGIFEHGATLFDMLPSAYMDSQHPQSQTLRAGQRVGENMSNFTQDLLIFQDVRVSNGYSPLWGPPSRNSKWQM